ncbi:hypothetical protein GQ44DRAFT_404474 [Phaeosphaeriaceae sp. PMI808]|nr:hypothetical protein GQ44DRAFT_404474 [Phaeosphaeriaceae sp. PMI808]
MSSPPNSVTQVSGIFSNCGPGVNTYELQYKCNGPACSNINGFQKVGCNSDGDTQICSNDVKCPTGISSYYSNFTFQQNEPDPWNPSSHNERDSLVSQTQSVSLPNCARFSLISDGTKEGTKIGGEGPTEENQCPKVQETPKPTAGSGLPRKTSSTGTSATERPQSGVTGKPQSSSGTRVNVSTHMMFITFLLGLILLLPGTHASSDYHRREEVRRRAELRVRDARMEKFSHIIWSLMLSLRYVTNTLVARGQTTLHRLSSRTV